MPEPYRRSPLYHRSELATDGARIVERPFMSKLALRGDATALGPAVQNALGAVLPLEACTSAQAGDKSILWIGPDEWWIVADGSMDRPFVARLGEELSGSHHQLVDLSDYYTTIELTGPRTREMLMKLTTLDIHARSFGPGRVAGSMFGRTQATLWNAGSHGGDGFRLFVRWSTADYLWCLLAEAGREYGVPAQMPVGGEVLRLER